MLLESLALLHTVARLDYKREEKIVSLYDM
jgi:hypothetical protein